MAVSDEYMLYVVGQLAHLGDVTPKRMFGGMGLYHHSIFFAILANDTLYFKVDESNRDDYIQAEMSPFNPYGKEGQAMHYYQVPLEVLENMEQLATWASKAIDVAISKKKGKRK